jgi:hypothetical protein
MAYRNVDGPGGRLNSRHICRGQPKATGPLPETKNKATACMRRRRRVRVSAVVKENATAVELQGENLNAHGGRGGQEAHGGD